MRTQGRVLAGLLLAAVVTTSVAPSAWGAAPPAEPDPTTVAPYGIGAAAWPGDPVGAWRLLSRMSPSFTDFRWVDGVAAVSVPSDKAKATITFAPLSPTGVAALVDLLAPHLVEEPAEGTGDPPRTARDLGGHPALVALARRIMGGEYPRLAEQSAARAAMTTGAPWLSFVAPDGTRSHLLWTTPRGAYFMDSVTRVDEAAIAGALVTARDDDAAGAAAPPAVVVIDSLGSRQSGSSRPVVLLANQDVHVRLVLRDEESRARELEHAVGLRAGVNRVWLPLRDADGPVPPGSYELGVLTDDGAALDIDSWVTVLEPVRAGPPEPPARPWVAAPEVSPGDVATARWPAGLARTWSALAGARTRATGRPWTSAEADDREVQACWRRGCLSHWGSATPHLDALKVLPWLGRVADVTGSRALLAAAAALASDSRGDWRRAERHIRRLGPGHGHWLAFRVVRDINDRAPDPDERRGLLWTTGGGIFLLWARAPADIAGITAALRVGLRRPSPRLRVAADVLTDDLGAIYPGEPVPLRTLATGRCSVTVQVTHRGSGTSGQRQRIRVRPGEHTTWIDLSVGGSEPVGRYVIDVRRGGHLLTHETITVIDPFGPTPWWQP